MKKILITTVALTLAMPALAAQQDITQISTVTASREALRTAVNTQLAAVQANFDEVYAVIDAGPVYTNTTAPADTKVVWIDTDQDNAIKVYVGGVWTVVGGGGSYILPTAAADTLGGVKVGDRLSIADGVLSADIQTTDISGKENSLGNPSVTGYVLSSTTAGVRSWIEMTGGGTGIAHATSDGNYYASKDGGWASLTGLYAAALGENDNYLSDAEKTRIGELESTDSPVFAGMSFGVASTTTGLVNFYGNAKTYPFGLYSQGADIPAIGWRLPSAMATAASVVAVDTNGYLSYLPSTAIVASGFDGNLATTDDTLQEVAQKVDDLVVSGAGFATYPSAAGVANWDGSAWGTSYTVGAGASNLVQLNASAQLPAVSADLLTIIDTGSYFTTDTVGAALQELGGAPELLFGTEFTATAGTGTVTLTLDYPVTSETYGPSWSADTEGAQRDDIYAILHVGDTDDDGMADKLDLAAAGFVKVNESGVVSSVKEKEYIGWSVVSSDTDTAVADGKMGAAIPAGMNGMNLVDFTCSVADLNSAASGATTVVLRRVRGGTAADMTSTGVTIGYNEYTASDEVIDTSNDDLATGDNLYVDINAVTTVAQKGLHCTATFEAP